MAELDDRIIAGMRDQLAARDELLRGGERQLGWKVGFGAPAALEKLGTDRPLVGFLLESALLEDGADVSPPPEDPRAITAVNIFQRHVMFGPVDSSRSTAEGIGGRVEVNGEEVAANDDPASLTGEVVEVVRLTAELLEAVGERLEAGQVVITGSAVPPVQIAPGQDVAIDLGPLGGLRVRLTD